MNEPVTNWPPDRTPPAPAAPGRGLHHAALNLAFDQQRIDDSAEIVDCGVAHHVGGAVSDQFHLGDVTAVRERRRHRLIDHMIDVERGRHAIGQLEPSTQFRGELDEADRTVGAGDGEPAGLYSMSPHGSFQHVRGHLLCRAR